MLLILKKEFLLAIVIIFTFAQNSFASIPAAYVDIGYGARPMGMGGAFVALANDAHAVLWNPAGLARLRSTSTTFMWAKQFNIIPYYFIAAGFPVNSNLALGAAAISSGNDVLRETTVLFSFSYKLAPRLSFPMNFGMNIKMRHASFGNNSDGGEDRIQGNALGFAVDLGGQWRISSKFYTGFLLRDVISPVSYNNETLNTSYSETIPPALLIGGVCSAIKNLLLAVDWEKVISANNHDKLHAGLEYKILNIVILRSGIIQTIQAESTRKYTMGFGLVYTKKNVLSLSFDFAYEIFFLANTPKVSTSIWF